MVESFGLLNDIFPFPSILDAGYPVFNLHLANILFNVILPSALGSSLIIQIVYLELYFLCCNGFNLLIYSHLYTFFYCINFVTLANILISSLKEHVAVPQETDSCQHVLCICWTNIIKSRKCMVHTSRCSSYSPTFPS
jgi:hypothetical protein